MRKHQTSLKKKKNCLTVKVQCKNACASRCIGIYSDYASSSPQNFIITNGLQVIESIFRPLAHQDLIYGLRTSINSLLLVGHSLGKWEDSVFPTLLILCISQTELGFPNKKVQVRGMMMMQGKCNLFRIISHQ